MGSRSAGAAVGIGEPMLTEAMLRWICGSVGHMVTTDTACSHLSCKVRNINISLVQLSAVELRDQEELGRFHPSPRLSHLRSSFFLSRLWSVVDQHTLPHQIHCRLLMVIQHLCMYLKTSQAIRVFLCFIVLQIWEIFSSHKWNSNKFPAGNTKFPGRSIWVLFKFVLILTQSSESDKL